MPLTLIAVEHRCLLERTAIPKHDFPLSFDLSTPPLQFHEMARSMGVQSVRVEKPWEIAPAIRQALAHPGPFLIDLVLEGDTHPELRRHLRSMMA